MEPEQAWEEANLRMLSDGGPSGGSWTISFLNLEFQSLDYSFGMKRRSVSLAQKGLVMSRGAITVTTVLLVILATTIWWAWQGWVAHSDVEMSIHGYIAMGLGIFFSLLIGFGLMALTFYSSRKGYDDLPQAKDPSAKEPASRKIS